MFKVGQRVTIDEIWAAGWMVDSMNGKKDISFVNDDETMGVAFVQNATTAVIYRHPGYEACSCIPI